MFNNREEAQKYLLGVYAKEGILDNIDEQIALDYELISTHYRDAYANGTDDITIIVANKKLAETQQTEEPKGESKMEQNTLQAVAQDTQSKAVVPGGKSGKPKVLPTLDRKTTEALRDAIDQDRELKVQKTQNTTIKKVLAKYPTSASLYANTQVTLNEVSDEKWAAYKNDLAAQGDLPKSAADDFNNQAAFDEAFAAYGERANRKFDVKLNERFTSFQGIIIDTPQINEGTATNVTKILNKDSIAAFLLSEVYLKIPTDNSTIGCELTGVKSVEASGSIADPNAKASTTTIIRWVGRSEAMANPDLVAVVFPENGEKVKRSLPTHLSFYVYSRDKSTGAIRTNKEGKKLTRKVTLRGFTKDAPAFQLSDEFAATGLFEPLREKGVISSVVTMNASAEAAEFLAELGADSAVFKSPLMDAFADVIESMETTDEVTATMFAE